MQPPTIYDSQASTLRLLLQGPPGSGKSCVAGQFPGCVIYDLDRNFASAYNYLRSVNKEKNILGVNFVDEDEAGKKVLLPQQFNRLCSQIDTAEADPKVQTHVLDSGTIFVRILQSHVLVLEGKSEFNKHAWGKFADQAAHFIINKLMNSRKHIVMTIHEQLPKDEKGFPIYPYKVTFPGSIGERIGMFFTNVWRCKGESSGFGPTAKRVHKIYTNPSTQYELKNTLVGLPAEFEFDWGLVEKHLRPINNTQTTK